MATAMKKQILEGKMIGGPEWSAEDVIGFLGDKFYGIPTTP